jgi:type 1 glutamine amidotransferase
MMRLQLSVVLIALASVFLTMVFVPAFASDGPTRKKHIVFLISEDPDNYEAHRTVPEFAEHLRQNEGYDVTVLLGEGPRPAFRFPGLEALRKADLLVVFCRRVGLQPQQFAIIKEYLRAGKPLIGIRTANHAFSVREPLEQGHEMWWEFVPDILGCENKGYGPVEEGTQVSMNPDETTHPILKGLAQSEWHSEGNLYLVSPLRDDRAVILLRGTAAGRTEPIAWTRRTADKGKVFYTSLGYPADFEVDFFRKLITNAIHWGLDSKAK